MYNALHKYSDTWTFPNFAVWPGTEMDIIWIIVLKNKKKIHILYAHS